MVVLVWSVKMFARTALRRALPFRPAGAIGAPFQCMCTAAPARPIHPDIPQGVVHVETRDYFQAVSPADRLGPHPGNKKVVMTLKVDDIELPVLAKARFKALCGPRFNANTGWLKLVGDSQPTSEANLDATKALLSSLVDAAKDPAAWVAAHEDDVRAKEAAVGAAADGGSA